MNNNNKNNKRTKDNENVMIRQTTIEPNAGVWVDICNRN